MQSERGTRLLDASFYDRHPKLVAEQLLGKTILRRNGTTSVKAVIIDAEAYGPINEDMVAEAKGMRTLRDWKPGLAWTTYYMWGKPTFEITTNGPGSVLVRGILLELDEVKYKVIRGPVNVAAALHIDGSGLLNKTDLTQISPLSIYQNANVHVRSVRSSNRINLRFDIQEHRRFFVKFQDLEMRSSGQNNSGK